MLTIAATRILVGLLLLAFGRRLFWLFVGAVGFVGGIRFADLFLHGQSDDMVIIFALVVGLLAAVLAVAVRKMALGAAGFLAGGYLLTQGLAASGQQAAIFTHDAGQFAPWITFLLGGLLGAILMNVLFTWTLIVLSSLGGAALVCESLPTNPQAASLVFSPQVISVVFVILAILGILTQSGLIKRQLPGPS